MESIYSEQERLQKIKGSIKNLHAIDDEYTSKNCTKFIESVEDKLTEINSKLTTIDRAETLKSLLKQDLMSFTLCITK